MDRWFRNDSPPPKARNDRRRGGRWQGLVEAPLQILATPPLLVCVKVLPPPLRLALRVLLLVPVVLLALLLGAVLYPAGLLLVGGVGEDEKRALGAILPKSIAARLRIV